MATKSQEVVKRAGIMMRISLAEKIIDEDGRLKGIKSTGEHKVKFIKDKVIVSIAPLFKSIINRFISTSKSNFENFELCFLFCDERNEKTIIDKEIP